MRKVRSPMKYLPLNHQKRFRLRDQFRRRSPALITAFGLWLAWALLSLALYRFTHGLLIALLLLGLLVLPGSAYGLLWVRRRLRWEIQRQRDLQREFDWFQTELRPRKALPAASTTTAPPDLLRAAQKAIAAQNSKQTPIRILEVGCGLSTLVMAYELERNGGGELFALEDRPDYADYVRSTLAAHDLQSQARILDAPLRSCEIEGQTVPWYDLSALGDAAGFDLLFIDGPASYLAPHIRYPALPLLHERLAPGALILVDDTHLPQSQDNVQRWLAKFPDLQLDDRYAAAKFSLFQLL